MAKISRASAHSGSVIVNVTETPQPWTRMDLPLEGHARIFYPPSIRGIKNTSAPGGTGWKYPVS
jgi:hypothetical protein